MKSYSQKGFSAVEFVIIALVVAVVGFVGYTVYDRQQNDKAASTVESSQATDVPAAPEIKNTDDLQAAEAVLDQTDTSNSADSSELDKQLNSF